MAKVSANSNAVEAKAPVGYPSNVNYVAKLRRDIGKWPVNKKIESGEIVAIKPSGYVNADLTCDGVRSEGFGAMSDALARGIITKTTVKEPKGEELGEYLYAINVGQTIG